MQIDPQRVNAIFKKATEEAKKREAGGSAKALMEGLPKECFQSADEASLDQLNGWRDLGMKAIAEGKVGVILLAGGQGTRLGSSAPKGCYDIGLPSHKSLFQLQAERIRRLQDLAKQKTCTDDTSLSIEFIFHSRLGGHSLVRHDIWADSCRYGGILPQRELFWVRCDQRDLFRTRCPPRVHL
jgi:hypothetical protein